VTPLANVSVERQGGLVVVTISGEIDLSNADDLEREIEQQLRGAGEVTINLEPVEYMDSRGVRLIHGLSNRLAASGVALSVIASADSIAGEVLRLTKLPALEGSPSSDLPGG
jgi:anti-anti-sigma factor